MEPRAARNNAGLTLIEVMVSLTILFIVFIGLFETVRIAAEYNLRSAINTEAVHIADNTIGQYRSSPFASLPTEAGGPISTTIHRKVRKMDVVFDVLVTPLGQTQTRTLTVTVTPHRAGVRPTILMTVIRS